MSLPPPSRPNAWQPIRSILEDIPGEYLTPLLAALARKPLEEWTQRDADNATRLFQGSLRETVENLGWDPDLLPTPQPTTASSPPHMPNGEQRTELPTIGISLLSPTSVTIRFAEPPADPDETRRILTRINANRDLNKIWTIEIRKEHIEDLRTLVKDNKLSVTPEAVAALKEAWNSSPAPAARPAPPAPPAAPAPLFPTPAPAQIPAVTVPPVERTNGRVSFTERGQILVKAAPTKPLVDALTRLSGLRWNDHMAGWLAPQSRLADIAAISETFGLTLEKEVEQALHDRTKPFVFNGTLEGLREIPLTALASVDAKKAERFADFGVENIFDALMLIPRRYIDRSSTQRIIDLVPGTDAAFIGKIDRINADAHRRMVRFDITDGSAKISLTYFNALWQAKRFRIGDQVIISGKVDEWVGETRRALQMANPMMDPLTQETLPIIPIYPQSDKSRVTTWDIHQAVKEILSRIGTIIDPLPPFIKERYNFMDRHDAIRIMHTPDTVQQTEDARTRLAFDELLCLQSALLMSKYGVESEQGIQHSLDNGMTEQFINNLPWPLTGAQDRVWWEVRNGLTASHPMHRLLQGDVGSGKTLVALLTLLSAVESDHQAALMAPTEILATQLYNELVERTEGILTPYGEALKIVLVTNKLRGKARQAVLDGLADGSINVAVGTHALIVGDVNFRSLSAVVIDEQHRFGVEQRAALRAKGPEGIRPDMLVMTATPIPRTAAMTVFGDLDVSVIDEMPPGRTPIKTSWIDKAPDLDGMFGEPWDTIRREVDKGHQAYVVCPLVEESEKMQAANATETCEELREGALYGLRLGLVHGQQKPEERGEIMNQFRNGDLDVLVATTVIEVGVNVPNSTIITILDCGRFGIAQLHQLRGRVGRGRAESECILVGRCTSQDSRSRMEALCASTDGFYLSEVDLELRGHGSLFGTAQSGVSDLKVADLNTDKKLLDVARRAAEEALALDPNYANSPELKQEIIAMLGESAEAWLGKS